MKALSTVLWHFPFLGFVDAAFIYLLGLFFTATVVGAPLGLGLLEFGKFLLSPFGKTMISKKELNVEQNKAWKIYSTIFLIIYFPFGLILCTAAAVQVFLLCITIIGIPPAMVIAKSMGTFLNPVNKKCVSAAFAEELERRKVQALFKKEDGTEVAGKNEPAPLNAVKKESHIPAVEMKEESVLPISSGESVCPNCGMAFPSESKLNFCSSCGTMLEEKKQEMVVEPENTPVISSMVPIEDVTVAEPSSHASVSEEPSAVTSDTSSKVPQKTETEDSKSKQYQKVALVAAIAVAIYAVGGYMHFFSGSSNEKKTFQNEAARHVSQPEQTVEQKAQGGDPESQFILGNRFLKGNGVSKNEAIAAVWFEKSASRGHPGAQFSLGWMYEQGNGVPQDFSKAAEWYQKAANQGDATAQRNLGSLYENGRGVPRDIPKSLEFYRKAALQGDSQAQMNISRLEKEIPKNLGAVSSEMTESTASEPTLVEILEKRGEQGDPEAQYNLGHMYEKGIGVRKNTILAVKWYRLASNQGNEEAKKALAMIEQPSSAAGISDPIRESLLFLEIPKSNRATVSATQVILRSRPSIQSDKEGMLDRGDALVVLDEWVADRDNEGILKNDISTESGYVLKKGRAVTLRNYNPALHRYEVIVQDSRGDVSGWVSEGMVKSLKGIPWYKIRKTDGKTGWVLSEFIELESGYSAGVGSARFDSDKTAEAFSPFMKRYAEAMAEAVNAGSISLAAPYLNPEGPLFKTQAGIVSDLYRKGIKRKLMEVNVVKATLEGGEVILFVDEEYSLHHPGGRVEKVKQGTRYRIRRPSGDHDSSLRLLYSAGVFS